MALRQHNDIIPQTSRQHTHSIERWGLTYKHKGCLLKTLSQLQGNGNGKGIVIVATLAPRFPSTMCASSPDREGYQPHVWARPVPGSRVIIFDERPLRSAPERSRPALNEEGGVTSARQLWCAQRIPAPRWWRELLSPSPRVCADGIADPSTHCGRHNSHSSCPPSSVSGGACPRVNASQCDTTHRTQRRRTGPSSATLLPSCAH